jgi:hypothetical protein
MNDFCLFWITMETQIQEFAVSEVERRGFQRSPIQCPVVYRPVSGGQRVEGTGINLSGGGILFEGAEPLAVGSAAEVHIDAVRGLTPPLTLYIEVVRCEATEAGLYRVAGAINGLRTD